MDRQDRSSAPRHNAWIRPLAGALAGGLAGFVLLHPYVMVLVSIGSIPGHALPHSPDDWSLPAILALEYAMLPMAAPLAMFGAAFGLLTGFYLNRALRLQHLLHVQENSAIALNTVRAFTDTLSHYLLNANMIIGGQVRHCGRFAPDREILESLRVIEEQGRVIDAVVGALRDVARITILRDSPNAVPMIDLVRELENRLRQVGGASPPGETSEP